MDKEKIIHETIEYVRENVPSSRHPENAYFDHVFGARGYALMLTREYKADEFVVDMAILLHDIGADAGKVHAQKSAELAAEYLKETDIDDETKVRIVECIETHSMGAGVHTLEQQIIQDADGLIFIGDTYKYFHEKGIQIYPDKTKNELVEASMRKTEGMAEKIRTEKGKELATELLPKALRWLKEQNE